MFIVKQKCHKRTPRALNREKKAIFLNMHNIDKKQRKHKNELKKSEKSKIVQLALINNMHTINQGNSCKKV